MSLIRLQQIMRKHRIEHRQGNRNTVILHYRDIVFDVLGDF